MARHERAAYGPLIVGLVVLLGAFGTMYVRSAPPGPAPADAPLDAFSAARAMNVLETLVGDGVPHPIGSEANARMRERVIEAFSTLGYATEVQATFACSGTDNACATVRNVVATRSAATADKVVLLVSHYDSVAAGPGASDAGVSVAVILEVARALAAGAEHRNPVAFLVTDGEEAGLIGASGFLAGHPLAARVGAVVNLEARGTSGPSVMFETSGENAWLVDLLARSLDRPIASSLFYPVYERLPNDTDLTVFKEAGTPGVNFAFIGDVARYHSPLDDIDHVSRGTLQHQGDNALAIITALADTDLDQHGSGNAVFFDILGFGIIRWPMAWTRPLSALALILVVIVTFVGWRRAEASVGRTLVGLVAWMVAVGGSALGAWRLLVFLQRHHGWPGGATTQTEPGILAFWLAGLGTAALVLAILGRWSRPSGAWSGCWLAWSAAGIGAAVYVPQASYIIVAPALVAGATGLVVTAFGRAPGALSTTVPLAAASVLFMPPAWMLFDALGPDALPIVGTVMALVTTAMAPMLAAAGRLRWAVPLVALGAAAGSSWMAVRAPAFSRELPERMSIVFFQEAGADHARWIVSPQSGSLPEGLRELAPFGSERVAALPWVRARNSYAADAPPSALNEPVLDVLERQARGADEAVHLRLVSPRKAALISLLLPPDRVVSVRVNGVDIPGTPPASELRPSQRPSVQALRPYTVFTVPAGGIELELVVRGTGPIEGYVVDVSAGLPPEGQRLAAARPAEAAPNGQGDVTILARAIRF